MKKALIPFLLLVISLLVSSVTSALARPAKPDPVISKVSTQRVAAKPQQNPTVIENPTPQPAAVTPTPVKSTPRSTTKKPAIKPKVTNPIPTPTPIPTPQPTPTPTVTLPPAEVVDCKSGSFNTQFLCLLNEYRKSKGLNTLIFDAALDATAVDHSAWMNENKSMNHTGLNGSKFYERCETHETTCDAENIAWGSYTRSALALFNAWKNSPGHNANMLGAHTKTGLGLAGVYATSLFR